MFSLYSHGFLGEVFTSHFDDFGLGGVLPFWRCSFLYEIWSGERLGIVLAVPQKENENTSYFCVGCSSWPCNNNEKNQCTSQNESAVWHPLYVQVVFSDLGRQLCLLHHAHPYLAT